MWLSKQTSISSLADFESIGNNVRKAIRDI
jgi:hypothetical protein